MKMNKVLIKTTSCVLSAALTMQIGWTVLDNKANAATSYLPLSEVSSSGNYYTIEGTHDSQWGTLYVDTVRVIPVSGFLIACPTVNGDVFAEYLDVDPAEMGEAQFRYKRISDGMETDYTSAGNFDYLINDDRDPRIDNIKLDDDWDFTFSDGDVIEGDELVFYVSDHYLYQVVVDGNVVFQQEPETWVNTCRNTFTSVPGTPTEHTVYAIDYSGRELNLTFTLVAKSTLDPRITLGTLPDVYYGQNYDFSSQVSTTSDYDISKVYFEYSSDRGDTILSEKPTAAGGYSVRAVAPAYGSYNEEKTPWWSFSIDYLPLSTLFPSGAPYFTVSGVVNGKYVPDALTLTAPDGILIGCPTSPTITDYDTSVSLSADDIFLDGNLNEDFEIAFVRSSDGATTRGRIIRYFLNNIDDYVFDQDDPYIESYILEDGEISRETSLEPNVFANDLEINIYDDNLSTIYVDIDGESTSYTPGMDDGYFSFTLSATVGHAQNITITAYDMAERRTTVFFTLFHEPVNPTLTVDFPNTFYAGEVYTPEVTTNSDSDITIKYYDGDTEIAYPRMAGTYKLVVSLDNTDYYLGTQMEKSFSVIKRTTTASVTVSDIMVGGTVKPVLTTNSNAKDSAIYEYKLADAPENDYSEVVPEAAGKYILRVTIPASIGYEEQTCTDTFTISKYPLYATVTVPDSIIGNSFTPSISVLNEDYDGMEEAVIEYKLSDESDSEYTETVPTAAGVYTVRVTLPETFAFKGTTCTDEFEIKKMVVSASVEVTDLYVGVAIAPVVTTSSDGKADTVFEYKLSNDPDTKYSKTVPTAAGSYSVRATVPETDRYAKIVCYDTFTISLNPVKLESFKVADLYVGQFAAPEFKSDSDGVVSFMYKPFGDPDTSYTTITPTAAGKYMVRATVQHTATYEIGVFTTTFTISYLETPEKAFTPVGTAGKEGYFTSDVELTAPEGYSISATPNGVYTKSITYTDGMSTVYLKRDDGARTAAITITNKPKIDKNAPKFTSTSGSLAQGSLIYTSNVNVTVDDQNLTSLTLNGVPVDLKTIPNHVLTLSPGMGTQKFVIVAEDIAGNVSTIEFTLKAEWLENKVIPADEVLPLETTEEYSLDDGKWTVTRNTSDNAGNQLPDTTVYNGNLPVYVNEDGDYTFTKVT